MFVIIGWVIVVVCVLGGYVALGGKLAVLNQPFELVIIGGAAIGAFVTGNGKSVLGRVGKSIGAAMKGPKYKKDDYLELLSLLYTLFRLAKTKGNLALEQHVENPEESELFAKFPKFMSNHHAVEFLCDYLRMVTLGTENAHEVAELMDEELDTHHHEDAQLSDAVQGMADALPALDIVAAVLGIIKTMGSITEPPEILGKLVGAALVGTFLGVWMAYGFVGPLSSAMKGAAEANGRYLSCIRAGIIAHIQGYAPQVSIEFARKMLLSTTRPTFMEVEEAVQEA